MRAGADTDKNKLTLTFENPGHQGAVLHVYDRLHLERIPRRYTVEAGRSLQDLWPLAADRGRYDLWVYGPNGFVREFRGEFANGFELAMGIELHYDKSNRNLEILAMNRGPKTGTLTIEANAYRKDGPWQLHAPPGHQVSQRWSLAESQRWYDFTVQAEGLERRFVGRMEDGTPGSATPPSDLTGCNSHDVAPDFWTDSTRGTGDLYQMKHKLSHQTAADHEAADLANSPCNTVS